jgi:hypothetical protein
MFKVAPFVLFFLVANPMTYDLTSRLPVVGPMVTDAAGRPTQLGVLLHALVFVLLMPYLYGALKN